MQSGQYVATCYHLSFAGDAPHDECDVGGMLAQTAHEVGKPVAAEWQIDPYAVPGVDQHYLQVPADAVEHLKLEAIGRHALFGRPPAGQLDHDRIVRGDR